MHHDQTATSNLQKPPHDPFAARKNPSRLREWYRSLRTAFSLDRRLVELNETDLKLNHFLVELQHDIRKLNQHFLTVDERLRVLRQDLNALAANLENHHLSQPESRAPAKASLAALSKSVDQLYEAFEREFRGSPESVAEKQMLYVPRVVDIAQRLKLPVCDMGCGRGEWLSILNAQGLKTIGIEPNPSMAKEAKARGIDIQTCDGSTFFDQQAEHSLAGVTSFHVAEHIPFDLLFEILQKANRALAPQGFILLETPNPENLLVGSCSFYSDPTHLKPLPPDTLKFYVEQAGFIHVEIIRSSPIRNKIDIEDPLIREMAQRFYGPQDYAIFGLKP